MVDRVSILFQASVTFKEALGTYAQQNNMPSSEVIRLAVAQYIEYDIKNDTISSGRPKIYASKEDRLQAQKERQKKERQTVKQLLEDYARAQRRGDVATMEEWLLKRGIDPNS